MKASYGFPDGSTFSGSKTETGWAIGGGLEYALSEHVTARAEYRYTDFGKMNVTLSGPGRSGDSKLEMPIHDVRVGLAYRF
ncbi:outer membrane beta-barrel protein [Sphingomonas sp. MMSM24]|uniref:Outer membrane beta-barrel protein n=1 Tax=Sphingomonas lycopersici TaxID=2951807 RepID=A0AA42CSG3_9SPHN|nr:outer membrane beta-barrel protein [Sphingomonas lycopersici]